MVGNVIIGVMIFAYAGWSLYRFIKKSKAGKCASCSEHEGCSAFDCDEKK
ncbi:FeoB-associated Cys-rich membrane protein [Anaerobacillus sp. CMMVII]|nr:FeoB-associated Cys-rich membrane protein [Anaerobacillus sp. CMMVII]MCT8139373.1 FeoB-associated Cys-rich membrane protein [Anaerobacillus sp. CMMVII]